MIRSIVISIFGILLPLLCAAQDVSLSQLWTMPSLGNPAATATAEEDYRVGASYRNQWASVHSPFKTSSAMGEAKLLQKRAGYMGVGAFVRQDKAGASQFGVFEAFGQAAYHLRAGQKDYLSAGIGVGFRQRSIVTEGLKWDSQFNGVGHDPAIDSGESFGNQQSSSIDASLGVRWQHRKRQHYDIGYAAWHYFQDQGFLTDTRDPALLTHQLTFNWLQTYGPVDVTYSVSSMKQGGAFTAITGARAKYRIGSDSRYTTAKTSSAVTAGIFYRYRDAIIPAIGYEYERKIQLFISYDVVMSSLYDASARRGGWELSLIWSDFYADSRMRLR